MMIQRFTVILLASLLPASALAQELHIHHLDIEQGDATLIVSPDGHALLFDAGNEGKGRDRVVPRLAALGVTHLDYTVLSHYDADHVGGLDEVIRAGYAPLIAFDRGDTTRTTQVVADYIAAAGPYRQTIRPGQIIALGDEVTLECVSVNGVTSEGTSAGVGPDEENESSVALLLRYRDFDYFIAGDLTGSGLGTRDVESLVAPIVKDVDVYRVSHHGSPTSSNQALVDRIFPEVAIISAGYFNTYAHPDQAVLDRLGAASTMRAIWVTNRGNATATHPLMRVVGESGAYDGEIVLATSGLTSFEINGVSYAMNVDRTPPAIVGGPAAQVAGGDRATITWTTDEITEARVEYGFTPSFGSTSISRALATDHAEVLANLSPLAQYYYRVGAMDASGNGFVWSAVRTFTTGAPAGGVVINEVASAGSDIDEWVELFNSSGAEIDLTGWAITDNDAHTFTLPTFRLPAKAYVVITSAVSGTDDLDASDGRATFHAGRTGRFGSASTWNNDGDDVELRNRSGQTVDCVVYGSGTGIDPCAAGHWTSDVANPRAPTAGQSVSRYPNGGDHNTASDLRVQAATQGASNGGEPPPPPVPPVADAGAQVFGFEGTAVSFDGSRSTSGSPGTIVSWAWDFGDGSTGSGATPTHVYADNGSYAVTLVVTDSLGLTSLDGTTADIANVAPEVSAGGSYSGFAGVAIAFSGSATDRSAADQASLEYTWTFGDGATATGQDASHVYGSAGAFTATLTVRDKDGGETAVSAPVTIESRIASPQVISARNNTNGTEYTATSAAVADLNTQGEGGAVNVSSGATRWFEARFGTAGTINTVTSASLAVAYRMQSTAWTGSLKVELRSGSTLLRTIDLPKATTAGTMIFDVTGAVTAANANNLQVRMINVDSSGTLVKVSWSYAGLTINYF